MQGDLGGALADPGPGAGLGQAQALKLHVTHQLLLPIRQVRDRLRTACEALDHAFWPDDASLRDETLFNFARVQGHNQITDLYLLGLAVRHRGCLATFDQAIGLQSVHGATPRHLMLL